MRNVENPGKPYYTLHSSRPPARQPYVAWTPDYHPWMQEALCDPWTADEWFDGPVSYALSICRQCPVRTQCLERALRQEQNSIPWGVAGAMTAEQRKQLLARQRRKDQTKCGTTAGYYRHVREGEDTCQACRDANAGARRKQRAS